MKKKAKIVYNKDGRTYMLRAGKNGTGKRLISATNPPGIYVDAAYRTIESFADSNGYEIVSDTDETTDI